MEQALLDEHYRSEFEHWWWRARWRIVAHILRKLRANKGPMRILDVGCSTGALWQYIEPDNVIVGLDHDSKGIKYAPRNSKQIPVDADIFKLPVAGNSVDAILAMDILEHLPEPGKALQSIHPALRPKGYVIATVPAYQWLWSKWDEMAHHYRRYTQGQLRKEVENAGYDVIYSSYINTFLFPAVLVFRLIQKLRTTFTTQEETLSQTYTPGINGIFEWIFAQERRFMMSPIRLPVGSSVILVARKR